MNYPFWEVPVLGGGWLIGLVAIIHIYIAHFAVGSGFFLVYTEWKALRRDDREVLDYIRYHSYFFVLITLVSGAVTGVGIWFTIGLVHPDATSALIHQFVFVWAIEWVFFLVEIIAALVYYRTWDRLTPRQHLRVGIVYAVASFLSLVAINGILTFMLTPGRWLETGRLWDAYFNPGNLPSLGLRTLVTFSIAGLFALVTAARWRHAETRVRLLRYAAKWLVPAYILLPLFAVWYLLMAPPQALQALQSGVSVTGVGTLAILTRVAMLSIMISATIGIFAYVGPYLNPKNFSFPMALIFLLLGLVVTGATEWSREMLRKPYVLYGYMYSNGLRPGDLERLNRTGVLAEARWTTVKAITADNRVEAGRQVFRIQCASCHTVRGYRSMTAVLKGRDLDSLQAFLKTLRDLQGPYVGLMPPLMGTPEEEQALAAYLLTISQEAEGK